VTMSSVEEVEAAVEQFNGYVSSLWFFQSIAHSLLHILLSWTILLMYDIAYLPGNVTFAIYSRNVVMFMVSYQILYCINQVLH
jgi:hypothetical protein